MSGLDMWTSVRVDLASADPKPSIVRVLAAWQAFADSENQFDVTVKDNGSVEWSEPGYDSDSVTEGDDLYLGFHSDSQVGGVADFGTYLTGRFPGVTVKYTEEWTGEEPGIESFTIRNGAIDTATTTDELPAGFRGTAKELALELEKHVLPTPGDPAATNHKIVSETVAFLRSLA